MTYQPMPAPAPKSGRTTRTILIVVAVVLAVCCAGGVGGGFWLYRTYDSAAEPARDATSAYLDDVRAGNYQAAYGRLCASTRDVTTPEEFTRVQSAQAKITSYTFSGTNVSNHNGQVRGVVTVRIVQETGAEVTWSIPLVKEGGEWRVCP
ncbi:DUF4878 domain-containing protein [Micromonospora sp. NPDC047074]|uniref:Rv0361 family membrane protein n=1 Tax=Micromonospora sp. NPDC047074 TaxID=3154339 RepID=UPI0033C2739E